ncbi:MAG: mucoidy inhibitor MuiA family protein [Pseudonocardia sp.]|uniref:mucoidy inhibitor MuiA family protein n=1 Tax=Pseudonocardia sp. TaxID=60912 RepID=UPI001AC64BB2|nr:mucoidy inhibitor MuiA family protein [Pseudonocardia sp.]MBN9097645.1 mucoidy inhibitor MuiA family protein [Pseudonocardia sp.]
MDLTAPIVAVTVHPDRARVTRRGRVEVAAGSTGLVVTGLPLSLLEESVRVAGRSAAAVRVVGVDVAWRDLVDAPDDRVRAAEAALRDALAEVQVLEGADAGDVAREQMLQRLALRSGDRLAAALADGSAGIGRVSEVGTAVSAQLVEVAVGRRANAERRREGQRAIDAARAELDRLRNSGRQRRDVVVAVEADDAVELELDLTYVVHGAGWSSAYDARLAGETLGLTWFGMVTQSTGEDWPECELTLSTARPAVTTGVPELDPWWVDVRPPMMPMAAMPAAASFDMAAGGPERAVARKAVPAVEAVAVESTVSASWRLARPTAVPGDGTPHRTTIAAFDLPARLDHVTAPALGAEAHLRAVVTNSGRTLLAGPVSTFLDDAFVGTTALEQTAPGGEIELALGVDDRVTVERELVERTAHKARFGSTRGAVERWRITVTNGRTTPARVTVRDRVPVSRNAEVKIVDVLLAPEPAGRDELGRVEWTATVDAGATWTADVRFGVEHAKDTPVSGWS